MTQLVDSILLLLKEQGFTIRQIRPVWKGSTNPGSQFGYCITRTVWSAIHNERGAKFRLSLVKSDGREGTTYGLEIAIHIKNSFNKFVVATEKNIKASGGHSKFFMFRSKFRYRWSNEAKSISNRGIGADLYPDLNDFIVVAQSIRGASLAERQQKDKLSSFEAPLRFTQPYIQFKRTHKRTYIKHFLDSVNIKGIVIIKKDLKISNDAQTPNADCWFHLLCQTSYNGSNASPNMLVKLDGDHLVYYPLVQSGQTWRISLDLKPDNTHIDFGACTLLDEELIRYTIEEYLNRI